MECPSCGVEMIELNGDDQTFRKCSECGGLWVDVSDLNRMLLHHNLPGLESIGGKVDPDAMCGQCPTCLVDLVRVMGGEKSNPLSYDTCESCGGIFLESEFAEAGDYAAAKKEIIGFFTRFSAKGKGKVAARV
jgi:Zn-finger nucleic acid-binding protein